MKKLFVAFMSTLIAFGADADVLTPEEALARLDSEPSARRMAARMRQAEPAVVDTLIADGVPALYLFADRNSMMVLSADSDVRPMVGYTDTYTQGESLPPALNYMLESYAAEIADLRAGRVMTVAAIPAMADAPSISPICTTLWNQGAPFNSKCPAVNGKRSVTGCVATAMAQVLKAYEYPARCSGGTYSYQWTGGNQNLTLDFDDVELRWDLMKDSYEPNQGAGALASLMRAVGYSADMQYSPSASATHGQYMAAGLVRNFDYDCTLSYEQRRWYTFAQWQAMIYDVLATGKPVYYDGANADLSVAHAFVVDGYAADGFFHINWGWGGSSNGYFRLSALDPTQQGIGGSASGYNAMQGAILGLKPGATTSRADAPMNYFTSSPFRAHSSNVKLGSDIEFEGGLYNNGPLVSSGMSPAIKVVGADGKVRYVASSVKYSNVALMTGVTFWTSRLPRNLAAGTYTIYPAVKNLSNNKYYDARIDLIGDGYITVEVEGSNAILTNHDGAQVECTDINIPAEAYPATPFYMETTVVNNNADLYSGTVSVDYYATGATERRGSLGAFQVDLDPGESMPVKLVLNFGADENLGNYDVRLVDGDGRIVSATHAISLSARPAVGTPSCTAIRVVNAAQDNLTFELDVVSHGGLFAAPVYVALIPDDGSGNIVDYNSSQPVVVDAGSDATATITMNFKAGIPGQRYRAMGYYHNGTYIVAMPETVTTVFELGRPQFSGISSLEDHEEPAQYFDMSGRRVVNPAPGIYIRRQGSKMGKVKI